MNMTPLFTYVLLRWREIQKISNKIGHPVYFLEKDSIHGNEIYREKVTKDNWVQTSLFDPDIITVYKNVPYIFDDNVYLKDIGSQTETPTMTDVNVQSPEAVVDYGQTTIEELENNISIPVAINTVEHLDVISINEAECTFLTAQDESNVNENDQHAFSELSVDKNDFPIDQYNTAINKEKIDDIEQPLDSFDNTELSLFSITSPKKEEEWADVVKQTSNTLKKVEGYIYDDYETFKKEKFNQLHATWSKYTIFKAISFK